MSNFTIPVTVKIPAQTITPFAPTIPEQQITVDVVIDLAALAAALSNYITSATPEA